jgi:hypothetical protein
MVLRCSLLGHDYGETEVEREREERGSEVVVTVREYEECTRCGMKDVISENTEVRSLASTNDAEARPDEPEPNPAAESTAEPTGIEAAFVESAGIEPKSNTSTTSAAEPTSAPEASPEPTPPSPTTAVPGGGDERDLELPTDENGEPVRDDGEILSDDGETTPDRGHGEWPDSDDVGPPADADSDPDGWAAGGDEESWPDEESAPLDDDAILLDTGTTTGSSGMAGGSPAARNDPNPGSGIGDLGAAPVPGHEGRTSASDRPDELYCPQCGFTGSDRSSLRSGDICPECKKSYLGDRSQR